MSKVTPVEKSVLSVKENSHLRQDMSLENSPRALGEFLGGFMQTFSQLDKTLNQNVSIEEKSVVSIDEESIPEESEYLEPDDRKEPSGIVTRKGGYIEL